MLRPTRPDSRWRHVLLAAVLLVPLLAAVLAPQRAEAAVVDGCLATSSDLDLNGDGFDDTAVGDPLATVEGQVEAGQVVVLFGDADGRIGEGLRLIVTQTDLGENPEAGDHFGAALRVATLTADRGCAGLVIGAPGEDLGTATDAGLVHLVRYTTDDEGQPTTVTSETVTQSDAGGTVETGDQFGYSVAVSGPTQEDPRRLIVGAPGETVGGAADAGSVSVFRLDGAASSLTELRQGKRAPLSGVRLPGTPEAGDRFGEALTTGSLRLTDPGEDTLNQGLVIGAPGDRVAGHAGAGSITVLPENFGVATLITQASAGVSGSPEAADGFGSSLALSPRIGSRPRDLAVGVPGEDIRSATDAGLVTLFQNTDDRFVPRLALSQNSAGVPGGAEAGDRFGESLVAGHTDETLLVGAPGEDVGDVVDAGWVQPVVVTTSQFPPRFRAPITEASPGVPGTVGARHRFGRALGAAFGVRENLLLIAGAGSGAGAVVVLSDASHVDAQGSSVGLPPREWVPGRGGIPGSGAHGFGRSLDR